MAGTIYRCASWQARHERPRYTLTRRCPACGGDTEPAAPARFNPEDPYGKYRRAFIRRQRE